MGNAPSSSPPPTAPVPPAGPDQDLPPEAYATTGYAPLDMLIDDEKAALAALLCSLVGKGNLDDLPRPHTPGPMTSPMPRPSSPVTASILAEFNEDD